jgi:hypothetical protein
VAIAAGLLWAAVEVIPRAMPNAWFTSGIAVWCVAQALELLMRLRAPDGHHLLMWRLRVRYTALLVATVLCGIGSAIHGGPIGTFGVVIAIVVGSWCLWFVQQLAKV